MVDTTTEGAIPMRQLMLEARERIKNTSRQEDTTTSHNSTSHSEPAEYWPEGIAKANPSAVDPGLLASVIKACQESRWPLLLSGKTGVGKSCLAAMIASRIPGWRFISAAGLLGSIMQARMSETKTVTMRTMTGQLVERTESEIWRWIETAPILVLDDVGMRPETEARAEALLEVVNKRFQKPFIVTTNCDRQTLVEHVGARVFSRLVAGVQFAVTGPDRRLPGVQK